MKIIYMGTPEFSAYVLKGLISKYKVDLVITNPDKPQGRKRILTPSFVKKVALENKIDVLTPSKIKEVIPTIKKMNPDLIITCAYGKILPKELLDIPRLGCINVHASLLPSLRGGAPIQRSIMDGLKETGITIMYMAEGMDDGDIISQRKVDILPDDTYDLLHDKLKVVGKDLLLDTLPSIINKTNKRIKQDPSSVTYGYIIKKEDEKIDLSKDINTIYNQIRGLSPIPGSYLILNKKRLKIYHARIIKEENLSKVGKIIKKYDDGYGIKLNGGILVLTDVQLEGKKRESGISFVNGHNLIGKILE